MKASKFFLMNVLLITLVSANIYGSNSSSFASFEKKFNRNISATLESDVDGVVQAGIYIVMTTKQKFPEMNFKPVISKLEELSQEGKTLSIRYKAQLAMLYLTFPELFKDVKFEDRENPDKYFIMINETLVKNSLASY